MVLIEKTDPIPLPRILIRRTQTLLASGNAVAAIPEAQKAQAALLRAWCRMPSPHTPEHRAFWCHSAFGVTGMDWDQAIKTLADNGFTAILPNMLWGGVAFYPSEVLPAYADLATRGDQIALGVDQLGALVEGWLARRRPRAERLRGPTLALGLANDPQSPST